MTLSICMIVKNEAANLPACLELAKPIADEIIVVDTGSTDDTCAIAQRLGARVFHFPWCDDFAAARNEAIRHATCEWIFILDADDRLAPSEQQKLSSLLASAEDADAYTMRCVALTEDGGVGWEIEHARLFKNDGRIRYQYRIHEQVVGAAKVKRTGIRLVHTGYVDARALPSKLERNLRLLDLDLADNPQELDGRLLYYKGATLFDLGRADEAAVTLQIAEPLLDRASEAGRWHALAFAKALRMTDRPNDALDVLQAARAVLPHDLDLAVLEAQLLVDLGELVAAGSKLAHILDRAERDLTLNHIGGWTLLGEIHLALGQLEAAHDIGRFITQKRPSWGDAWLLYSDALLALDRIAELDEALSRLSRMNQAKDVCAMIEAARQTRAGNRSAAIELLDSCSDPLAANLRARVTVYREGPLLSGLRQTQRTKSSEVRARADSRPIQTLFEGASP